MKPIKLPRMICLRVTRRCNAFCHFCLAPLDDIHPGIPTLQHRIDWLLKKGVKIIHFCGGEPTLHEGLAELLIYTSTHGSKSKLTTNGINISQPLLDVIYKTGTHVKVSLHGNREHHNHIVGTDSFDLTVDNISRLLKARIPTSVQTTIVSGKFWVLDWIIRFCLDTHVKKLSLLPFIPRGRGGEQRNSYELTTKQRIELRKLINAKRREFSGQLDIRWLDFNTGPFYVLDADGRLLIEGATEFGDRVLYHTIDDPILSSTKS